MISGNSAVHYARDFTALGLSANRKGSTDLLRLVKGSRLPATDSSVTAGAFRGTNVNPLEPDRWTRLCQSRKMLD
jgi:hypothetical protein